jgi:hypothetical protein
LLAGAAGAQDVASDLRLAGTVINAVTGMPLRQALVTLNSVPEFRRGAVPEQPPKVRTSAVLTDATGHFQVSGLEAGSYSYKVSKQGFAAQSYAQVTLGSSKDSLVISLQPLAKLHGKVLDGDGEPVPGVSVRALHSELQDGRRVTRQDRSVTTDDQGEYRMWNFEPGDYYFVAAGRGGGTALVVGGTPAGGLAHEGFEPVYYPAAKDQASARVISLAAGQEFQADLKIHMQPAYRVRGVLRSVAPYQAVTVQLVRGSGDVGSNRVMVNGATGRFEVNDVVPGTYLVRAVQNVAGKEMRGEQEIRVGDVNLDAVMVELSGGVRVSGVVRGVPNAAGPEQLLFTNRNRGGRTQVALMPVDADSPPFSRFHAVIDEQGKFAIEDVPAGRYRLDVSAFNAYVASAVAGTRDLLVGDLVIGQGVAPEPIEAVLRNDGGTVSGKLEGSAGGNWVLLLPGNGGEIQRTIVGPDGAYQFAMVAPGDYEVFAIREIEKLEFRNPAVVRALRGREKVHVTAGATVSVTLKGFAQ